MIAPWRAGYRARSMTTTFRRRLARSIEIIKEFLDMDLCNRVMWSGGKDSTAMVHLAWAVDPSIYAASEKDDMDFPGERAYVEYVAARYGFRLDVIEPDGSLWTALEETDITEEIHARGTAFSDTFFYSLLERYHTEHAVEGIMLGLRKEESRGRKMNTIMRGCIYQKSDGCWVCCPLADWEGKDVMAYLISRDIPILDVYFKTRFAGKPENIRKSWILPGAASARRGQVAWLRYYYPALYARLYTTNPELGRFT